jgi:hypothetical protein
MLTKEELMDHNDAIRLFDKTLQNLEAWMDKATEYAKATMAYAILRHNGVLVRLPSRDFETTTNARPQA